MRARRCAGPLAPHVNHEPRQRGLSCWSLCISIPHPIARCDIPPPASWAAFTGARLALSGPGRRSSIHMIRKFRLTLGSSCCHVDSRTQQCYRSTCMRLDHGGAGVQVGLWRGKQVRGPGILGYHAHPRFQPSSPGRRRNRRVPTKPTWPTFDRSSRFTSAAQIRVDVGHNAK